jgi:hypothetical protein
MRKSLCCLLGLLAILASVSCDDDDSPPPTGPSATTVTQTGATVPQPPNGGGAPFPAVVPAPSQLPAPNHPIFGDVNAVSGLCPVILLTVGDRTVVTDRTTVFRGLSCRGLRKGIHVTVRGRSGAGGTMIATVVEPD